MRKISLYMLLSVVFITLLGACNKKSDEEEAMDPAMKEISYSNTAITSFSLKKDNKVLTHLDSVHFSIDLNSATVFNADSLPKGTNVSKLVLKIGLPTVAAATIIEPSPSGNPRYIDYLTAPGDSINLSMGYVTLHVVSYDEAAARDYTIKVNVHKVEADSLYWNQLAVRALPGNVSNPTAQKSVMFGGKALSLVTNGSSSAVSINANPGLDEWTTTSATLPSGANLSTLTACGSNLYMLDNAGKLYSSPDGAVWTACDATFHWLYGDYNGSLLASRLGADGWEMVTYPQMTAMALPPNFPVDGTSTLVKFETQWSQLPTAVMVGGRKADGKCIDSAWGYDGTEWAVLNVRPLPQPLCGVTLIPYFSYVTSSSTWVATKYATLVAIGGMNDAGDVVKDVVLSVDNGVRWKTADKLMQLPEYIPAMCGADGLVFAETLTVSRSGLSCWHPMASRSLPAWLTVARGFMTADSRAVAPITEWECPYIYLFGGVAIDGQLQNSIWRGVINRLTFKPLQ